jgi:hypothetical protein
MIWVLTVVDVNGFYKIPINCLPSRISQIAYKLSIPKVTNLYKSKVQLRGKLSINYEILYPIKIIDKLFWTIKATIGVITPNLGVITPIVALIVQNSLLIVLMRYTMISTRFLKYLYI